VLRAQDKLAEPAIQIYRILAASHGSPVADDLQKEIDAFRRWSGPKKMPN
jgi:flavorubredoxin